MSPRWFIAPDAAGDEALWLHREDRPDAPLQVLARFQLPTEARHLWPLLPSPPATDGDTAGRCVGCGQPLRRDGRGLNTCDTAECPGNIATPGDTETGTP